MPFLAVQPVPAKSVTLTMLQTPKARSPTKIETANRDTVNKTTIYARTARGNQAAAATPQRLARKSHDILKAIDGRTPIEALRTAHGNISAAELDEALVALVAEDYIRNSAGSIAASRSLQQQQSGTDESDDESARKAQALRAKIRARREEAERSTQEAESGGPQGEEQARRDAEERSRQEAEAQSRRLAEDEARRKAEDEIRRKAEDEFRRKAEEEARRKAEEEARRKAEEESRRKAEEEAGRKAEEEARRKAEEEARRKAEEESRRKAEEEARRKAEEEARRKAEEESRRKAEEESRRKADDEARRKAEEEARRKVDEESRRKAEEEARRKAEEEARGKAQAAAETDADREAAERARQRAEVQARLLAEEQAWLEAEEKARREEEAAAGKPATAEAASSGRKAASKDPVKWGKALALGLGSLLVAGLVAIHLISFDGQIPQFEKLAAAQLQQPVKIKAIHLALVPQPHLRLEGVSIGGEGQIRVPGIKAVGDLGNLYSEKKAFKLLELDSPVITEEGLGWILFGKSSIRDVAVDNVSVLNATLESKNLVLSAFDAKLAFDGDGGWKTIVVQAQDKTFSLELTPKGQSVQLDINAKSFKVPFGSTLVLEDFVAKGTADAAGLALAEFKGFVFGGTIGGTARLKWGGGWSLAGELNAKQIDTTRLIPELMDGGRVAGDAVYAMQAPQAATLFAAPHLEGTLAIPRGTLLGVDLGSLLQGGEKRGDTKFTDLSAGFVHEAGATQFRQVRLGQGGMAANGTVDVDADKNVRGRFAADLKLSSELRRANFSLSGTLKKIEWRRL